AIGCVSVGSVGIDRRVSGVAIDGQEARESVCWGLGRANNVVRRLQQDRQDAGLRPRTLNSFTQRTKRTQRRREGFLYDFASFFTPLRAIFFSESLSTNHPSLSRCCF